MAKTVNEGRQTTLFLQAGYKAVMTTGVASTGRIYRRYPGAQDTFIQALAASTNYTVGPFDFDAGFTVHCDTGSLTVGDSVFSAGVDIEAIDATVPAGTTGELYTIDRKLDSSTITLVTDTTAGLTATGGNKISFANALLAGASVVAMVREQLGTGAARIAYEYPINFTATATPTPTPSPTLGALTLVGTLTEGVAASGVTLTGALEDETITLSGADAGLTVEGPGDTVRTVSGTPTSSGSLSATQTSPTASNSPRGPNVIGTVAAAGGGALDDMLLMMTGVNIAASNALGRRHAPNDAEVAAITTNIVGPCEVANNKLWAPNITGMTFTQNADHFSVTYDGTGADLFWPIAASCPASTTMTMQFEFDNQTGSAITLRMRRQNTGSGDSPSSSSDIVVPTGVSTQSYTFANVLAGSYYLQIEGQAGNAFTSLRITKVGLFAAGSVQSWNTVNKHIHRLNAYSIDANDNIQTTGGANTGANKAGIVTLGSSALAPSELSYVAAVFLDTAQISSWNGYGPVLSSGNYGLFGDTNVNANRPFHFRVTNGMLGLGNDLFSKGVTPIGAGWCVVGVCAGNGEHIWINDMKGDRVANVWSGSSQFLELLGLLNNSATWTWPGKCQMLGAKVGKWTDSEWLTEVYPAARQAIIDEGNTFNELPITAIVAGDSIAEGTSVAGGFVRMASVTFSPTLQSYNMAVGGSSLGDWVPGGIYWNGLIAAVDAELDRRGYSAVVMRVGTNNIRNAGGGGIDGAALVTQLVTAFDALKARATLKGLATNRVRIVAATIIPWGNEVGGTWAPTAQQTTDLNEFNVAMRAASASYDGLMDFDASPIIGSSMVPYANSALFQPDRLHPSQTGILASMPEAKAGLWAALSDLLTPIDILDSIYLTNGLNSSNSTGTPLSVPNGVDTTIYIRNVPAGATLSISSGAVPAGMTFNAAARTITGTPTTPSSNPIGFQISGTTARNNNQTYSRSITIT